VSPFNKLWFERHQRILVWLLNHWTTRRWFRGVLRIDEARPIIRILPNSYTVFIRWAGEGKIEVKTDFRTYAKYAKRLYYAFFIVWLAFHIWDYLIADRFAPAMSFGFSTLTVYPDPGDPGTTSVDGFVAITNAATWADAHDATDGSVANTTQTAGVFIRSSFAGGLYGDVRFFALFDTSALGSGATVSNAVLSFATYALGNTSIDNSTAEIVSASPASNTTLGTPDYDQLGTTSFASMTIGSGGTWSDVDGTYNDFTLNASGRANISSTGVSKFAVRVGLDLSNVAPTGVNENNCYRADNAGNASDPKLVITYTAAPLTIAGFKGLLDFIGYPVGVNPPVGLILIKTASDTVDLRDAVTSRSFRAVQERQDIVDSASMRLFKKLAEQVDLTDAVAKALFSKPTEQQVVVDALTTKSFRRVTDVQTITDSIAKLLFKFVSDNRVDITDSASGSKVRPYSAADTIDLFDSVKTTQFRRIQERQDITDSVARLLFKVVAERVDLSDSSALVKTLAAADQVIITDAVRKLVIMRPQENQALADALARTMIKGAADRQTVTDAVQVLRLLNISERVALSDAVQKTLASRVAEQQVVADEVKKIMTKIVGEREEVADAVGTATFRKVPESVGFTDRLVKTLLLNPADQQVVVDDVTKRLFKTIGEPQAVTDDVQTLRLSRVADFIREIADIVAYTIIHTPEPPKNVADFIDAVVSEVGSSLLAKAGIGGGTVIEETKDAIRHAAGTDTTRKTIAEIIEAIAARAGSQGFRR
jgi:hypothetical protein